MNGLTDWLTSPLRGTLTGWQWLTLLAIPPAVVLLYFLKLKRHPIEVPSTFLWHRTIEDLHVNSIWQKLRQNLLLFLQLLLLLLAILACWRPSWEGTQFERDRKIFLVDTSASMSATDVAPSRLELAKQQILNIIDNDLKSGDVAMVISFSDRPIVEQSFTDNRRALKRKIEAIAPTQRPSDLDEAVRVAAGLANPGRLAAEDTDVAAADALPADLIIFSDGRYRTIPQFTLGNLSPTYIPVGDADAANVGIMAFSAASTPDLPGKIQLFGQLQNFGKSEVNVTANLVLYSPDRHLLDAVQVKLDAGDVGGVEFTMDAMEGGEVRLELDSGDALALDNVAFVGLNPRSRAQVLLVTPQNDALETVLRTEFSKTLADIQVQGTDYLASDTYKQQAASSVYDVIIYDQCRPDSMPACNTYFIGELPPGDRWSVEEKQSLPQIIDTERTHPLMRYVEMGDLKMIVEAQPLVIPAGGTSLLESHVGSLIAIAPRDGFEDLVQSFSIVGIDEKQERFANTDWPIRVSFPVFIGNVLTYLGGSLIEANQSFTQPGQPVTLRTDNPVEEITVGAPNGESYRIPRGASNTFVFGQTDTVGTYTVKAGDDKDVSQRFAVNLFDVVESNLPPAEILQTKDDDIQRAAALQVKRREGWKFLLIAALIVLLIEWYIYNRRVYI